MKYLAFITKVYCLFNNYKEDYNQKKIDKFYNQEGVNYEH